MSNQPPNESKCCPYCQGGPTSRSFCVNASCSCHKEKRCEKCRGKDMFSGETFCTQEAHGIPCDCHYPINTGDVGGGAGAPEWSFDPINREWEEEFNNKFVKQGIPIGISKYENKDGTEITQSHIKDFIRSFLHSQQTALRYKLCKKIELLDTSALYSEDYAQGFYSAKDKAIEIIRGKE